MNEQELKPCPFCGNKKPKLIDHRISFFVRCDKCNPFPTVIYGKKANIDEDDESSFANVDWDDVKQSAIDAWNTRADGWIVVESAEDLPMQQEVLCWDGCDYHLDYADMDSDTGTHYMANGTCVEAYKLLTPPKAESCGE